MSTIRGEARRVDGPYGAIAGAAPHAALVYTIVSACAASGQCSGQPMAATIPGAGLETRGNGLRASSDGD